MRKLLISFFAVSILGLGGALAQQVDVFDEEVELGNQYWGGISLGVPFGVNFHFGLENLLGDGIDLRANASAGGVFGLGADVLFNLPVDTGTTPIDIYAGGGLNIAFGGDDNGTDFGIGLLAGVEYRLVDAGLPEGGVFAEVGPRIEFGDGAGVNAKLGFNYHF